MIIRLDMLLGSDSTADANAEKGYCDPQFHLKLMHEPTGQLFHCIANKQMLC